MKRGEVCWVASPFCSGVVGLFANLHTSYSDDVSPYFTVGKTHARFSISAALRMARCSRPAPPLQNPSDRI